MTNLIVASVVCATALVAQSGPGAVTVEKDVVYSQGARLMMDVARPASAGPHPAVLTIGGEGFKVVDRATHEPLLRKLAERGYVVAAISYRVGARNQFPAALQDVKTAIRFLRANAERFALDPARVCAVGESAGATLALLTARTLGVADFESNANREQPATLACVVAASGVSDFSREYGGAAAAAQDYATLLGRDATNARKPHALASPVNWITPQAPPVLVVHAAGDKVVPSQQSTTLADRLRAAGVDVEVEAASGDAHGLTLLAAARTEGRVLAFLDRHLGRVPPAKVLLVADHGGRRQAHRLPNGHTLITMTDPGELVEVDRDGRIVRAIGGARLDIRLIWASGFDVLESGNLLLSDYLGRRILEIGRDGKVVHEVRMPTRTSASIALVR